MKHAAQFLVIFAVAVFASGCGTMTQAQLFAGVNAVYNSTVISLTEASVRGDMSREQLEALKLFRAEGRAMLTAWDEANRAGDEFDGMQVVDRLMDLFNQTQPEALQTRAQQYAEANAYYNEIVTSITESSVSGNISKEHLQTFKLFRAGGRAMLAVWDDAIRAGEEFDGTQVVDRLRDLVIQMKVEAIRNRGPNLNTTQGPVYADVKAVYNSAVMSLTAAHVGVDIPREELHMFKLFRAEGRAMLAVWDEANRAGEEFDGTQVMDRLRDLWRQMQDQLEESLRLARAREAILRIQFEHEREVAERILLDPAFQRSGDAGARQVSDNELRYKAATIMYVVMCNMLTDAIVRGDVSAVELEKFRIIHDEATALLLAWDEAVRAGEELDGDDEQAMGELVTRGLALQLPDR